MMEKSDAPEYESHTTLRQWPVQLMLIPPQATFLQNADLLIAADCCAYAHGDFHKEFMQGKVTLIGCPKQDTVGYANKIADMLEQSSIASVTVARMSVPCCGGLERAVREALTRVGNAIPHEVRVVSPQGAVTVNV